MRLFLPVRLQCTIIEIGCHDINGDPRIAEQPSGESVFRCQEKGLVHFQVSRLLSYSCPPAGRLSLRYSGESTTAASVVSVRKVKLSWT